MEQYFIETLCSVISLGLAFLVPVIYKRGKAELENIEKKTGESTYNMCKNYLIDLAKVRPESFYEDTLAELLDTLDNKFGNHLSIDTIKMLVDFVIKEVGIEIKKSEDIKEVTK